MDHHDSTPRSGNSAGDLDDLQGLLEDLKQLQVLGIRNPDLPLSPRLLSCLGLKPDTPNVRRRLFEALLSASTQLDPELRTAFLFSASFQQLAGSSRGDRIQQVAQQLSVSRRTAYRRVEAAKKQFAGLLLSGSATAPIESVDFETLSTECAIDLSSNSPTVLMTRTLRSLSNQLRSFDEHLVLRSTGPLSPRYRAVSGCKVVAAQSVGESWSFRIAFPRPLAVDECVTFTTRLELPNQAMLEDSMLFSPVTSAQRLRIGLKFSRQRLPVRVERYDGVLHALVVNQSARGTTVPPDAWSAITFPAMKLGYLYGVRWFWPTNPA